MLVSRVEIRDPRRERPELCTELVGPLHTSVPRQAQYPPKEGVASTYRKTTALGTIVVERLLDGLALVLALNLGLLLSAQAAGSRDLLLTVAALATAGLVAAFAVAWHFEALRRRLEGLGWPWLQSRLRNFGETLAPLRGPDIWQPAVLTVVIYSAEALAIGDGANDLAMIEAAGLGLAYRAKPAVAAAADARIEHADLTAALYFQGIRRAEFSP